MEALGVARELAVVWESYLQCVIVPLWGDVFRGRLRQYVSAAIMQIGQAILAERSKWVLLSLISCEKGQSVQMQGSPPPLITPPRLTHALVSPGHD